MKMSNSLADPVEWLCHGTTLRAIHYAPRHSDFVHQGRAPCIVLAHGLGGVRTARLDAYAERFAQAGFHALAFDYRFFGQSDGQPRQNFNIRAQLDDWASAIAFARELPGVDAGRIALWGSSFSGGHVVVAAAEDGHIQAVSSQGPMMDGRAAFLNVLRYAGVGQGLRLSAHAVLDALMSPLGKRHTIALVAAPGEVGVMTSADAVSGYTAIASEDWHNTITSSWLLQLPLYRPIRYARRLPCPILIGICMQDSVAPVSAAEALAKRAGARAQICRYDVGHFDIYVGAAFEQAVADQIAFFTEKLGASPH
ncbi:alpha/beta fold hydrolase [Sinimarinibacterium sp. NLF-5-8]|nr:alpha/beta fold hydrolase [Sinimarinibacterium sp. NLF-5-8]